MSKLIKKTDDLEENVETLKQEFELQHSLQDVTQTLAYKVQQSRDKICDVLRRVQSRRDRSDQQTLQSPPPEQRVPEIIAGDASKKPQEVDKRFSDVLRRRQYIKEFKNYLENKKNKTLKQDEFERLNQLDKITAGTQKWVKSEKIGDSIIFEYFFRQINVQRKDHVHDLQVRKFLNENPMIMQLFNLNKVQLQMDLDRYPRKTKQQFTEEELVGFFLKHQRTEQKQHNIRSMVHLFDPLYSQLSVTDDKGFRIQLISEQTLNDIQNIFNTLDSLRESAVDQDVLFSAIRDQLSPQQLFDPVVHLYEKGVNIHLESVLQLVEMENINNQYAQNMISWNQFMSFLSNFPDNTAPQENNSQQKVQPEEEEEYFFSKMKNSAQPVDIDHNEIKEAGPPKSPIKLEREKYKEKNFGIAFHQERLNEDKITIPRSQTCEKVSKPSKRDEWVIALAEEKRRIDEEACKYKPFKANSVPKKVKDRAVYNELKEMDEIRRREAKERSQTRINELSKPFSFDERDKMRKIIQEQEKNNLNKDQSQANKNITFRANPAPWFCSLELYQRRMRDKAYESMIKKEERKQWLMNNSKMPKRMQEYQDKLYVKNLEKQAELEDQNTLNQRYGMATEGLGPEFTFFPNHPKEMPDFHKLHTINSQKLEKLKRSKKTTKPQPPKFSQTNRTSKRSSQVQQVSFSSSTNPLQRAKQALEKKPKIPTMLTKKFQAQMEYNSQERQFKKFLEAKEQFEEQQRQERKQLFVPRVQGSWVVADSIQQRDQQRIEKLQQLREQQRINEEEFNNMMKDIFLRVYQRPLLMEQVAQDMMVEEDTQQAENDQLGQNYGYGQMNPIGEDDELEYMKNQEEEEEGQGSSDKRKSTTLQLKKSDLHREEDPEGVELVGDEAEQSGDDIEFAKEDYYDGQHHYQQDDEGEDGEEYIDLDNLDPEILRQLQKQAQAEGYNLELEGYEYEDHNDDEQQYMGNKHHSF